jgi:hypothetical protein
MIPDALLSAGGTDTDTDAGPSDLALWFEQIGVPANHRLPLSMLGAYVFDAEGNEQRVTHVTGYGGDGVCELCLPSFPRRGPWLGVRLLGLSEEWLAEFRIPQPAVSTVESWAPSPMPQRAALPDGHYVTLTHFVSGQPLVPSAAGLHRLPFTYADFRVERSDGGPSALRIDALTISDSTGNRLEQPDTYALQAPETKNRFGFEGSLFAGESAYQLDLDLLPSGEPRMKADATLVVQSVSIPPVPAGRANGSVNASLPQRPSDRGGMIGGFRLHGIAVERSAGIGTTVSAFLGAPARDRRLVLLDARDERGRTVPGSHDRPLISRHSGEAEYTFVLSPSRSARSVDLTFGLLKPLHARFRATPERWQPATHGPKATP